MILMESETQLYSTFVAGKSKRVIASLNLHSVYHRRRESAQSNSCCYGTHDRDRVYGDRVDDLEYIIQVYVVVFALGVPVAF